MSLLKSFRVAFAALFFSCFCALFLDFSETVPTSWHRLAHFQLTPSILDLSFGILAFWLIVTAFFGRVYCSFVCPLGILQDVFSRISKLFQGKRFKFLYRTETRWLRYPLAIVFVFSLPLFPLAITLLDPYSHFGRIATSFFRPLYLAGNNFLAGTLGSFAGLRFTYQPIHVEYPAAAVAIAMLLLVAGFSLLFGRRYCNMICPVGTLLGLIAKLPGMKIRLKPDCVSCGLCEKACKGECIDSKNKTVDSSRCVACFNCLGTCRRNSVVYSIPVTKMETQTLVSNGKSAANRTAVISAEIQAETNRGSDRRLFLHWSVFSLFLPSIAGSLGSARSSAPPPDSSLPTGVSRIPYEMEQPVLPPGAVSRKHFQRHCTACHLCVSKCPANIIRPSTMELGLSGFLQPVVKFDYGFCNFDCTICTEVCPSHALIPQSKDEKHRLQIGKVIFLKENCVVHTQGSNCGACAEHCPTGAVAMVPYGPPEKNLTIPEIDPDLCVGCGACEYICPVRPYRAIYVHGEELQGEAKLGYDPESKQQTVVPSDFGF